MMYICMIDFSGRKGIQTRQIPSNLMLVAIVKFFYQIVLPIVELPKRKRASGEAVLPHFPSMGCRKALSRENQINLTKGPIT